MPFAVREPTRTETSAMEKNQREAAHKNRALVKAIARKIEGRREGSPGK